MHRTRSGLSVHAGPTTYNGTDKSEATKLACLEILHSVLSLLSLQLSTSLYLASEDCIRTSTLSAGVDYSVDKTSTHYSLSRNFVLVPVV